TALGAGVDELSPKAGDLGVTSFKLTGAVKWGSWALLLFVFFAACITTSGIYPNVANALVLNGSDIAFAGTVLAVVAVFNVVGNVTMGIVGDRIGIRAAIIIVYL